MTSPLVSVIIPTCATPARAPLLSRALQSVLDDQNDLVIPIVIVNGQRYVPEVLQSLQHRPDIRCLYLEEGDAVKARLAGRKVVDTEFFGILDDDDEYLPGAVRIQLGPLLREHSIDAVITNGFIYENGRNTILWANFAAFEISPLNSLMDNPWLIPGGVLCRSESVSASYLEAPRFMEMTYMAMKLALSKKLYFLNEPTYQLHRGTPESLSNTKAFAQTGPEAILQMLGLNPPPHIKRRLKRNYSASLHGLSDLARVDGDYRAAWRYHLKSLFSPYGFRYILYTRHLARFR